MKTMIYADDTALLAKNEKVLHDILDKLVEIEKLCDENNIEKTIVMRISRKENNI